MPAVKSKLTMFPQEHSLGAFLTVTLGLAVLQKGSAGSAGSTGSTGFVASLLLCLLVLSSLLTYDALSPQITFIPRPYLGCMKPP